MIAKDEFPSTEFDSFSDVNILASCNILSYKLVVHLLEDLMLVQDSIEVKIVRFRHQICNQKINLCQ